MNDFYNFKTITIISDAQCNNAFPRNPNVKKYLSNIIVAFEFRGVRLSVSNDKIRQIGVYTFYVDRYINNNSSETAWSQQMVPSTANLTITFPT